MNDKISVIIPIYNAEAFLERCLYSVVNNTYKNIEIICINDGSTDNSSVLLEKLSQSDSRIVVINRQNKGVSSARNLGLEKSTGDFIAFVDADDWVHPNYFEVLYKAINEKDIDVSICSYKKTNTFEEFLNYDREDISFFEWGIEDIFNHHFSKSYVWGRLYRKSFIINNRFNEEISYSEDAIFNAEVFCSRTNAKARFVDLPLYYYFCDGSPRTYKANAQVVMDIFEKCSQKTDNDIVKRIYTIEAIKVCLGKRYMDRCYNNKTNIKKCNIFLQANMKVLMNLSNVSLKEKIIYYTLVKFPDMYRIYRIYKDPSLLNMEKNVK